METIRLGSVEVEVVAQRYAYLARRVPALVDAFQDGGRELPGDVDAVVQYVGGGVYDLLAALIPRFEERMPRWRFLGFGSQKALDDNEYDEQYDETPTLPELKDAVATALRVNGFTDLVQMGKALGFDLREFVAARIRESDSLSSAHESGGSDPTSSGMIGPTGDSESEESPFLGSPV